jgi:SAM-dependent methyltransferase
MIDQVEYWNGQAAERWVADQTTLDAKLRSFSQAVLAAASVAPDEHVLDVGCGCGDTSLTLAALVGEEGRVVGLDVSTKMLGRAKERGLGLANLSFIEGDAGAVALEQASFDVLISRFGVMFFSDPTRTFTHLRGALKPGGRLAFVCWRPLSSNPWATAPFEAATSVLGRPEPAPADAPGPFAFGDDARVRTILEGAGFRGVSLRAFDGVMAFGKAGPLRDAAEEIVRLGPVARLLVDRTDAERAEVIEAIEAILPVYTSDDGGIRFPASTWIVTAENPA